MTLKTGTVTVNGIPFPDNLSNVSIGNLAINATTTVIFDVDVTSAEDEYVNSAETTYTFTPEGNNPPPSVNISSSTNPVTQKRF